MAYRVHRGIRTFTGPEATNILMGQAGFDIIEGAGGNGTEVEAGVTAGYEDVTMWVAIKIMDGDMTICARTLIGDDLSTTGTYSSTTAEVTIKESDMVNGAFDKIRCIGTSEYVIAYRGIL